MKNLLFIALFAVVAMSAAHLSTYTVDTAASKIVWTGYKVTGQHTGNVNVKSGSFSVDHGKLVGGEFLIDMTSITSTDMQGEWGDKLVGHLKADDFFGSEKFPTSKFVITRAIPVDTKGNFKIVGNLTIKEKTNEIKFNAAVTDDGKMMTAAGKMTIDRSEFDIKYGSGSFFDGLGDKTIYDDFDMQVALVAKIN
jgi:polyisoprenoid-binding protein YceI